MRKFSSSFLIACSLITTACSGNNEAPATLNQLPTLQATATNPSELTQIIDTISDIKDQLSDLNSGSSTSRLQRSATPRQAVQKGKTTKLPVTSSKPEKARVSVKKKEDARAIADKLFNKIKQAPFIQAEVEKYEKHLDKNDVSTNKLQLLQNNSNSKVKIDVLYSSKGSTGVKLLYTSGVDKKIKVRPNGTLSFLTTDLPIMDDRITSLNGYPLDKTDLKGLSTRLSQSSYKAELIGATKVNGQKVHVLKMTASGQNELDSRITHEHIGFDPETYDFKFWEAYTPESKQAYYRFKLNQFLVLPSISADKFKL